MPVEIQGILDSIGSLFDNPFVQLAIQGIGVYIVVLWLAAAFWAFRDLQLRTTNPILPYLSAAFVIVFTPVFFPLAVIVYRIVRPQERIGEVTERELAEEALIAEVEAIKSCPTCNRRVDDGWILCPTCRTRLNRVCPGCGRLVGLDWSLCAWCGRDFERHELQPARVAAVAGAVGAASPPAEDVAATPSGRSIRGSSERSSGARASGLRAAPRGDAMAPGDPLPEP
ncbi:MAG TPA: zinc ribbon domain-containing protein [Candidatus Dormibacteraeota bacterium]|nr:zinc ribbon domain-containing protein [Candidatus Dormibacteraeota bacterium]